MIIASYSCYPNNRLQCVYTLVRNLVTVGPLSLAILSSCVSSDIHSFLIMVTSNRHPTPIISTITKHAQTKFCLISPNLPTCSDYTPTIWRSLYLVILWEGRQHNYYINKSIKHLGISLSTLAIMNVSVGIAS